MILKKIIGSKNSSTYPPIKSEEHSLPISDNKIKADLFNNYFCSQSVVIDKNTELPNYDSFSDTCRISNILISTQAVKDV